MLACEAGGIRKRPSTSKPGPGTREVAHPKDSRGEGEQDVKEEVNRTPGEVKEAQRVVGELIWLVTRCRPDIMYVTALMAALTTRRPLKVLRMAYQVWGYLAGNLKEGLVFQGVGWRLDGLHRRFVWRRRSSWLCGW